MREHTNGTKYVGTVENWGDEMLMESHKLKMMNPPFQVIDVNNVTKKYFEQHYSDNLPFSFMTTSGQCLSKCIALHLKENVLPCDGKHTRVRFEDCYRMTILNANSSSEPYPQLQRIYITSQNPKICIDNDYETIDVRSDLDIDPTYCFCTTSVIEPGGELTDREYERNFINPDSVELIQLQTWNFETVDLKPWMKDLPFVWITSNPLIQYKEAVITGNDVEPHPILTLGVNGHDNVYWYPNVFEINVPPRTVPDSHFLIRVFARHDDFSDINHLNQIELRCIELCEYDDVPAFRHIISRHQIKWDCNKLHVFLPSGQEWENRNTMTRWSVRVPQPDDTDYDGMTYINPPYLYAINVSTTVPTTYDYEVACPPKFNNQYCPLFQLKFDTEYDESSMLSPRAQSGIHIDFTSDYSEHNVEKKNGTTHNLGEFDGLPYYYKTKQARYYKRGRMALYTLRDWIGNDPQIATNRQSAGLLIDSGLPHNDSNNDIDSLNSVIKFQYDAPNGRTYHTVGESVSKYNALSDIVYNFGNSFGDVNNQDSTKVGFQMVYHGNRSFSTTVVSDLEHYEHGRVYIINNDPCEYDNNDNTSYKKPGRTFARICDIPTDFRQLIGISGLVATTIIDPWYVHTDVCFSDGDIDSIFGDDLQRMWKYRETNNEVVMVKPNDGNRHIFNKDDDMTIDYGYVWMLLWYRRFDQMNKTMEMLNSLSIQTINPNYQWTIVPSHDGENYRIGDIINTYVGVTKFKAVVTRVDGNGGIIVTDNTSDVKTVNINKANFNGRVATYDTFIESTRSTLVNAKMQLEISQQAWDGLNWSAAGVQYGCFTFRMNEYDQLTLLSWNVATNTWDRQCILTGEDYTVTHYNEIYDMKYNTTNASIIYKMTCTNMPKLAGYDDATYSDLYLRNITTYQYPDGSDQPNDPSNDFSRLFVSRGFSDQDSYFILEEYDGTDNILRQYSFPTIIHTNPYQFPKIHQACIYDYIPKCSSLLFSGLNDGTPQQGYVTKQPNVYVYFVDRINHEVFKQISSDVVEFVSTTPITFMIFDQDTINPNTGILLKNVYKYVGYEWNEELQTKYDTYSAMARDHLYREAIQKDPLLIPSWVDTSTVINPVQYAEEYGTPYTKGMLIDYLMQFEYKEENDRQKRIYRPVDERYTIKKIRSANERVVDIMYNKYTPIGEQPTGDIVSASATVFDGRCHIGNNQSTTKAQLTYIMKIPDDVHLDSLDGFRMKDQLSHMDISDQTLLIYQGKMYTFNESYDKWIEVYRG